jgi:hypothetical protein
MSAFTLLVLLLLVHVSNLAPAAAVASPPDQASELVHKLRGAILGRDIDSVKFYLEKLEILGTNLPKCATAAPTAETKLSKKSSKALLRKHEESSTALLSSLTQSVQTCKKDLQRVNHYVDASRKHQVRGGRVALPLGALGH